MLKDVLFPSRSLDVSQSLWQEIFWIPGLCSQTLETDALRLHWELCSGRGLICGDSLGKQFHLLAFYWKLLYRLLHVNKLYSLSRLLVWLALLDSFFLGSCISIVTIKPTIIRQIPKTIPLFKISRFTFTISTQSFLSTLFKIVATQNQFLDQVCVILLFGLPSVSSG